MPALGKDDVIANDVQVGNSGHDFCVGVCIVERRYDFEVSCVYLPAKIDTLGQSQLSDVLLS